MRIITYLVLALGMLFSKGGWDGQTRFTVLEHTSEQIRVRSFDPQSLQGTVMIIPDDLEITSVQGRGSWPAKNIFKAGTDKWAADSIIDYLGLSYTGLWSNLSIWNRIAWSQYQNKVTWVNLDLTRGGLTQVVKTTDGQDSRRLNSVWFDQAKQLFSSQIVTDQHLSLSIINTTDASGLGSHAADVAESMGFKVDSVTDDPTTIQKCQLEVPEVKIKDVAIKLLAKTFICDVKVGDDDSLKMALGDDYKTILR